MSAPVLDMAAHLALHQAALADRDYRRAYALAAKWDPDIPDVADPYGVAQWAVTNVLDGWLLGCVYRDLTGPWHAVMGTDPMEVFK